MKNLAFGALLIGLLVACGGGSEKNTKIVLPDGNEPTQCSPLMQTGCAANEKCTWIVDAYEPPSPQYVGHIGCVPNGVKKVDENCTFGAAGNTGYDDCEKGLVCNNHRGRWSPGFCKQICDQQGSQPPCDAQHACVNYSRLFSSGPTQPAVAGVCDALCDPLLDNDFDGMGTQTGSAFTKRATACRTEPEYGCYGSPGGGTEATEWSCARDNNYNTAGPAELVHRKQCIDSNKCSEEAGSVIFTNSCNQGYLPLLEESTGVTTRICVAMCKPVDCYAPTDPNCGGVGEPNRVGIGGDSCTGVDRKGTFDNVGADGHGEHCLFGWRFEVDSMTGTLLESPTSNTIGYCYDHDKYTYDNDADPNTPNISRPPCASLQPGIGDAASGVKAGDLGCHSTALLPLAVNGKTKTVPPAALANMRKFELPRAPYTRVAK